jgi:hypothetical protein
MTDLANRLNFSVHDTRDKAARPIVILAAGLFGGLTLGIIARAWMRLISEDPEFTWNGTIFIVGAFAVFGFTQAIVAVARRRERRRWALTVIRVVGIIGLMPLFVGAGAVMLPTVVAGGLARARVGWNHLVRWICLSIAMIPVLIVGSGFVGSFGWSLQAFVGLLGMVAIYATVVSATRFTFTAQPDGWRIKRWVTITLYIGLGLLLLQFIVGFILR